MGQPTPLHPCLELRHLALLCTNTTGDALMAGMLMGKFWPMVWHITEARGVVWRQESQLASLTCCPSLFLGT